MTSEETTLFDFTAQEQADDNPDTQEDTNTESNKKEKITSSTGPDDQDGSPGGSDSESHSSSEKTEEREEEHDHVCEHYTDALAACEDLLNDDDDDNDDDDLVRDLNLDKIKCGHAIDYLGEEVNVMLTENTVEGYSSYLRQYVEFLHQRGTTVCDAEMGDVKRYFNRLAKLNRKESTIAAHRSAITNLYKHIFMNKDIETGIMWSSIREVIKPGKYNTPEPREREPLTKEELKRLYESAGSFRNRLIIQVGAELGPRNQDLRSIRISDVDLENNQTELSNTKGGGRYSLPISNELSLLLRRWVEQERSAHAGAEGSDYLFPSTQGGSLGKPGLTKVVKKAAKRGGIQERYESEAPLTEREKETLGTNKDYIHHNKVTPHTLRHTFNHLLTEAGIPRDARSAALDHQSEEVTKEFYDHQESNYEELMQELFASEGSLSGA